MLVLPFTQELWSHGDSKGIPGRWSNVPPRGQCVKLWKWSQGCSGNLWHRRCQECGTTSAKKSQRQCVDPAQQRCHMGCKWQAQGWESPSPLDLTASHHVMVMLNMELQNLAFALQNFILTLVLFTCLIYSMLKWEWLSCAILFQDKITCASKIFRCSKLIFFWVSEKTLTHENHWNYRLWKKMNMFFGFIYMIIT